MFLRSPPFDANNQAELNRKIKAGNVPELPRGYSTELGAVIRSMLELNVSIQFTGVYVPILQVSNLCS